MRVFLDGPSALSALPEPPERWLTKPRSPSPDAGISTVEGWVRDGCPSRMVGANRRFQYSQVDAWLTAREAAAEAKTDAEEMQA